MTHVTCRLTDCQEPGSAPEPYARQSSMGYTFTFLATYSRLQNELQSLIYSSFSTFRVLLDCVLPIMRSVVSAVGYWKVMSPKQGRI